MKNNKFDTIICDFGKVLVHFDHRIAVRKILEHTPKTEKDVYDLFFDSPITGLYEEGKISSYEFFNRVKDILSLNIDYNMFLPIWNDIFFEVPLNTKLQDFLRKIKPNYRLVMVSNISETHFEFLKDKTPILKVFDKLILSYEVGYRKPAPEIYKLALDAMNSSPDKTFYIDDREDLIEAAGGLGINGIVFSGEEALREIVEELDKA